MFKSYCLNLLFFLQSLYNNIINSFFPIKSFKVLNNRIVDNYIVRFTIFYYLSFLPFFNYLYFYLLYYFDIKGEKIEIILSINNFNNYIIFNNNETKFYTLYSIISYIKCEQFNEFNKNIILMQIKLIQNEKEYDIKEFIQKYINNKINNNNFKYIYYFNKEYFDSINFNINNPFTIKYKIISDKIIIKSIDMNKTNLNKNIRSLFC
jgi:hypothetical protein